MSRFWQTKPKKDDDWRPKRPRKVVIDEKHLLASRSCPECRGRGYIVMARGDGVRVMTYCGCVTRQLSKADREGTIVLRSP
jgi:Zn ribbon nucleic-acid-binding protein